MSFSKLAGFLRIRSLLKAPAATNVIKTAAREMSGHGPKVMAIQPSRFQWHKFKDLFHFYAMVGLIPVGLLSFYANVFIGPAELAEIPEGYEPKHWEYHRHPITRWMARYVYASPQQDYEKMCHMLKEETEKMDVRRLEKEIKRQMSERNDYQAWYYRPGIAKYHRVAKQAADDLEALEGDN